MKKFFCFFTIVLFCLNARQTQAQQYFQPTNLKIAVFAPLYIDSAFNGYAYKLGNNNLPKIMLPGLDFYNGVMLAIDSLQKEKINAQVLFYDTKNTSLSSIILKPEMQDVSLIIASFNDSKEIKTLADFALQKKALLVSATFPNDDGVRNNPYFVILNSTLATHCQNLYKYLQQYYSTSNIIYVRRKGYVGDYIKSLFLKEEQTTPAIPLKYKVIELDDVFSDKTLLQYLNNAKNNTVVCGSINEAFGLKLARALSLAATTGYRSTLVGMPSWENVKDFDKSDCKGIDIIYSTAYNFQQKDKLLKTFNAKYQNIYAARASDWALKGFETMYRFTKLVFMYGDLTLKFISNNQFELFNNFDIKPIITTDNFLPDTSYLENKKIYFVKKNSGIIVSQTK